jgi:hypothetical protein
VSRLDEIQTRAEAATPGPWQPDTAVRGDCVVWGPDGRFLLNQQAEPHWLEYPGEKRSVAFDVDRRDCEFIANAREDVPWLIDQIRDREARLRQYAEKVDAQIERIEYLERELMGARTIMSLLIEKLGGSTTITDVEILNYDQFGALEREEPLEGGLKLSYRRSK